MKLEPPGPEILESMRHRPLGWHAAIGELVDNSFDAGATRVEVDVSKTSELVVTDDGKGCPNVPLMLSLAKHQASDTTSLGRYGVGLKDAGCWLWGELNIETVHRGQATLARLNWESLSKSGTWEFPDPIISAAAADFPCGTRLRFSRHKRRNRPSVENLMDALGYTFWPALSDGRQIVVIGPRKKRCVCAPWNPPPLSEIVEDAFEVDGKPVTLRAGIVPADDSNEKEGFNFAFGHRNIFSCALGAKGHSIARICGIVRLGKGWNLSTNKTGLSDDPTALGEAIWERCERIIRKSEQMATHIFNRELETEVSKSLRGYFSEKKREKRDKGDSHGTVESKNTGRKRRNAKKTSDSPGIIQDIVDVSALSMEWRSYDNNSIGKVDAIGSKVYLNSNHARMKQHREGENLEAIVDWCLTLLTITAFENDQRERLPYFRDYEKVSDALSNLALGTVDKGSPVEKH